MSNARCYKTCQCDAGTIPGTDPNRCASVNVRGGCRWVPDINPNARSFETDGVVTKENALGMPGAIPLTEEQMHMPGSQHMQMRNDPNLKDKLNNLFIGAYERFFFTL
jgi:hypothetical protein